MITDVITAKRSGFVMKINEEAVDHVSLYSIVYIRLYRAHLTSAVILKFVQMCHHPLVDYIEEDQEVVTASQWHLDRLDFH